MSGVEPLSASSPAVVPGDDSLIYRGGVMASVTHGGRALMFARQHKLDYREVLDFSANINPLGPSTKALEAIRHGLDLVRVYPDEKSLGLVRCLSNRLRVGVDTILPGNGATDLLYFWMRTIRPRTATLIIPTFSEYRLALEIVGTAIQTVQLDTGKQFRLTVIPTSTDVVILTNPTNPTGSYVPPEEMLDWIAQFSPSPQIFFFEAFVEFSAQPSLVHYVERFIDENLRGWAELAYPIQHLLRRSV